MIDDPNFLDELEEALRDAKKSSAAISRAFAVPPMMVGNAPEPRSIMERGARLIAEAEAFGIDPLDLRDPDVDAVVAYRLRRLHGFTPCR